MPILILITIEAGLVKLVDRIIERPSSREPRSSFGSFKDYVFGAVIVGAGYIIWQQQQTISDIKTHLAVLDLKCRDQPIERGASDVKP